MKKFNLVLLVLVAALFGSSFVACSNGYSGFDDPETPAYATAVYNNGIGITFIPVSGTITAATNGMYVVNGYQVVLPDISLDFTDFTESAESIKNKININLYRNSEYVMIKYDNDANGVPISPNELYKLEITDEDVTLTAVTAPEPESAS